MNIIAVFAERWIRSATHPKHLDNVERWLKGHNYPLVYYIYGPVYAEIQDTISKQLAAKRAELMAIDAMLLVCYNNRQCVAGKTGILLYDESQAKLCSIFLTLKGIKNVVGIHHSGDHYIYLN